MEIWRLGRAPQRIVPMAMPMSGSRGRRKEGRETRIVEGFEPSVKKPIWHREGELPPNGGQRHFLFQYKRWRAGDRWPLSCTGHFCDCHLFSTSIWENFNYGNFSITLTPILSSTLQGSTGPFSTCLIEESAGPMPRKSNSKRQVLLYSWDLLYLPSCGQQERIWASLNSFNTYWETSRVALWYLQFA